MTPSNHALVTAALAGDHTAFATLVARFAPTVTSALPDDCDVPSGLERVFTTAMQQLYAGTTPTDVDMWLHQLTKTQRPNRLNRRQAHSQPRLFDHDLDGLWHTLAPLWPTGRKRRIRLSRPVQMLVAGLALLLGGIYAVMQFQSPRIAADTLIATVYQADNANQSALDTPLINGQTLGVPVIPLPAFGDDETRPQQPSLPPADDVPTTEPNPLDDDEPADETADEPDTAETDPTETDPTETEEPSS